MTSANPKFQESPFYWDYDSFILAEVREAYARGFEAGYKTGQNEPRQIEDLSHTIEFKDE